MKTPIKKIILDLGGKEIELTLEQAKTLFGALNEMFGSKTTYSPIYVERPDRWWWTWTYQPITIGTNPLPPGTIIYTNTAAGAAPLNTPHLNNNTAGSVTAQMNNSGTLRLSC